MTFKVNLDQLIHNFTFPSSVYCAQISESIRNRLHKVLFWYPFYCAVSRENDRASLWMCLNYLFRQLSSEPAEHKDDAQHHAVHDQGLWDVCEISPTLFKRNTVSCYILPRLWFVQLHTPLIDLFCRHLNKYLSTGFKIAVLLICISNIMTGGNNTTWNPYFSGSICQISCFLTSLDSPFSLLHTIYNHKTSLRDR
jgi:hypothetical protein